eukprot:CAMPEP_0196662548 /NCGR_PEP_ID=MMETSP1086-20130531/49198_1 /TAXON_ID=77921 /ORGANISM="Cyanoptyche  gloeocystis , Strain SAG4.97" /LENGTH=164 /DNA_ID=CAMNT_0041997987 /DNA_START=107 /DNA_END=601 /DNA_ORIENTATION=+
MKGVYVASGHTVRGEIMPAPAQASTARLACSGNGVTKETAAYGAGRWWRAGIDGDGGAWGCRDGRRKHRLWFRARSSTRACCMWRRRRVLDSLCGSADHSVCPFHTFLLRLNSSRPILSTHRNHLAILIEPALQSCASCHTALLRVCRADVGTCAFVRACVQVG